MTLPSQVTALPRCCCTLTRLTFALVVCNVLIVVYLALKRNGATEKNVKCVDATPAVTPSKLPTIKGLTSTASAWPSICAIDIARARRNIVAADFPATQMVLYKTGHADNYGGTGVYSEWHTDTKQLMDLCALLLSALRSTVNTNTLPTQAELTAHVVKDFVARLSHKLDSLFPKAAAVTTIPWGSDWRAFALTLTNVLAHSLLLLDETHWDGADLILRLTSNPRTMLGQDRPDALDQLRALGPWLMAMIRKKKIETAVGDKCYIDTLVELNRLSVGQKNVGQKGVHLDWSFFDANKCVALGQLCEIFDDALIVGLDGNCLLSDRRAWKNARRIIGHPKIAAGNVGMIGPTRLLVRPDINLFPEGRLGLSVMPLCGYLKYATTSAVFNVRVQSMALACYQGAVGADDMAQYWIQYRNVHRVDVVYEPTFPDIGFIYAKNTQSATHFSVSTMYPKQARSFVLAYESLGVAFQRYNIPNIGNYVVTELVCIDAAAQTVVVHTLVENLSSSVTLMFKGANDTFGIGHNVTAQFKTSFSLAANGPSSTTVRVDPVVPANFTFPMTLMAANKVYNIEETSTAFVLFSEGVMKRAPVLLAPRVWTNELIKTEATINFEQFKFTFNSFSNQYLASPPQADEPRNN